MVKFGNKKSVIVLIDPDNVTNDDLDLLLSYDQVPFCWLVGGSLLLKDRFEEVIQYLKNRSKKPVVIFPGNSMQVSANADAILFLSLLSGRNPDFLIGQQVLAAPIVKRSGIDSIPTAYLIIDGGKETSVSYISNTKPMPRDKPDIALATAMAAELLGKQLIYLEAGSGADDSVPMQTVSLIKKNIPLPLIVGGGVKNIQTIEKLFDAGADHVVIGNYLEENPDFLYDISQMQEKLSVLK
jgi:phosphoglycerol geranylgeranyltransferase